MQFGCIDIICFTKISVDNQTKNLDFFIRAYLVEDGKVHVICSPADRVFCTYEKRAVGAKFAEHGELVTEVAFDADPELGYFRITVRDEKGNVACTNAYFPEDYL